MIFTEIDPELSGMPLPTTTQIHQWAKPCLPEPFNSELYIRITDNEQMQALNQRFRKKASPTNVLAFPAELPNGVPYSILGDIVLCAPVINQQAQEQNKPNMAHWAHMIVHGILHLRGYDHKHHEQSQQMESLEITHLQSLGFDNPYESKP